MKFKIILTLIKISFDNSENRDGQIIKKVGVFDSNQTINKWFEKQPNERKYCGWDGQIYPQYKIENDVLHT